MYLCAIINYIFIMKNKFFLVSTILLILLIAFPDLAEAQCAMCKATAEQSDQVGLNKGILLMFMAPYILVGSIGYVWYKNKKNVDENE